MSEHFCGFPHALNSSSASPLRMLDHLDAGVDRTENKLGGAMKKMKKFIRDTEGMFSNAMHDVLTVHLLSRNQVGLVYSDPHCHTDDSPCCCCPNLRQRWSLVSLSSDANQGLV